MLQALVYLAAAVIAVPLAKRLGLGSALGYLLAGLLIGPYFLALVGEEGSDVMHFAEFGVVLMLFIVGLELEPSKLWRLRVPILGLGGAQVVITALAIGTISFAFGYPWQTAVLVGLTLSLSSTAMVLQTLEEKGWMKTAAGQRAFSVLLFQDIAVIPILAAIPFLALSGLGTDTMEAGHGPAHGDMAGWVRALMVIGVVVGIWLAGRYLAQPFFRYIARTGSREIFMATALLLIIGVIVLMNLIGLSPALGTFVAGVVLADSEFRHQLESDIEPFKGLLLGLFFLSVGASIDLTLLAAEPGTIFAWVVALIGIKFLVLYFLGRFFKLPVPDAALFAFALAQGGEFAFLLVSFALQSSAVQSDTAGVLILVVILSMILTPLMIILFERVLQPRLADRNQAPEEEAEMEDHGHPVIIAGYGRFGQIVARTLKAGGFESTLLDHDAGQIEMVGRFGNKVFYGDASRADLLLAAGAANARLLVIAIDDPDKAVAMVETTKALFPHLRVLARAVDRPHTYRLMKAGVDFFARETFGSALAMGEEALRMLGVPDARAHWIAETFEKHDTEGLHKLYEVWGDEEAYGFRIQANLAELERVLADDREDAQTAQENPQAKDTGSASPASPGSKQGTP